MNMKANVTYPTKRQKPKNKKKNNNDKKKCNST